MNTKTAMNKAIPWVVCGAAIAGGALYYYLRDREVPPPAPAPVAVPAPAATAPPAETAQHFPAPQTPEPQAAPTPLPALEASDSTVLADLGTVISADAIAKYVVPEQIVRNIVVTVDNLPRKNFAWRLSPVRPVGGAFRTAGGEGSMVIAADNASRYDAYVDIAKSLDAKKMVWAYGRLYPLFQKVYEDLGYPKGYFNDRLVTVIDHLLATAEQTGSIALVNPGVQPQFADPDLEALSAGQKILVRIGPANAAAIKDKLRDIRKQLVNPR